MTAERINNGCINTEWIIKEKYTVMSDKKCVCGNPLTDQNVYYSNRCNEEGEEYSTYEFECEKCKLEIEASEWGECDNILDAIDLVADRIKEKVNSNK